MSLQLTPQTIINSTYVTVTGIVCFLTLKRGFYCFLHWYSLSNHQYENTGLDNECVGIWNMEVLENELQGERNNRIENAFMLGQILECPHWDTELPVSALGHTAVSALGDRVTSVRTGKHSGVSILGHTVTRVSALGHTAVSALGDRVTSVRTGKHSGVSVLWHTAVYVQLAECPYCTQS
jgi:hypothetical protein